MNLTEVSKWFKKSTFYLGGFILFYYILILVIVPSFKATIKMIIPDRNPPNPIYGALPPLEFTSKQIIGTPKYELNTPNGKIPTDVPTRAKVYKMKQMSFSYNAGKTAQDNAAYFNFLDTNLITDLKGKVYKWRSLQTGGTLEIDIDTKRLTMTTPLSGKSSIYQVGYYTDNSALREASQMLDQIGRFDSLYTSGTTIINKGKYVNNKVVKTEDRADAQLFKIDFFRSIDGVKILGPDPTKGLLQTYIGKDVTQQGYNERSNATFPIMDLAYNEIDPNTAASYPLVDLTEAWANVKQGKGVVASVQPKGYNPFVDYEPTSVQDILINKIYIAYYETPTAQKYLQPIYVFEGNYKSSGTQGGDIMIYFPAISGEYVQEVTKQQ